MPYIINESKTNEKIFELPTSSKSANRQMKQEFSFKNDSLKMSSHNDQNSEIIVMSQRDYFGVHNNQKYSSDIETKVNNFCP